LIKDTLNLTENECANVFFSQLANVMAVINRGTNQNHPESPGITQNHPESPRTTQNHPEPPIHKKQ